MLYVEYSYGTNEGIESELFSTDEKKLRRKSEGEKPV